MVTGKEPVSFPSFSPVFVCYPKNNIAAQNWIRIVKSTTGNSQGLDAGPRAGDIIGFSPVTRAAFSDFNGAGSTAISFKPSVGDRDHGILYGDQVQIDGIVNAAAVRKGAVINGQIFHVGQIKSLSTAHSSLEFCTVQLVIVRFRR